eukprot:scaffold5833_cov165-Amphora_coffeaeformis.AAC.23
MARDEGIKRPNAFYEEEVVIAGARQVLAGEEESPRQTDPKGRMQVKIGRRPYHDAGRVGLYFIATHSSFRRKSPEKLYDQAVLTPPS